MFIKLGLTVETTLYCITFVNPIAVAVLPVNNNAML
jgi:hypothetical protein